MRLILWSKIKGLIFALISTCNFELFYSKFYRKSIFLKSWITIENYFDFLVWFYEAKLYLCSTRGALGSPPLPSAQSCIILSVISVEHVLRPGCSLSVEHVLRPGCSLYYIILYFNSFYRKINAFSQFYRKTQCVCFTPSHMLYELNFSGAYSKELILYSIWEGINFN